MQNTDEGRSNDYDTVQKYNYNEGHVLKFIGLSQRDNDTSLCHTDFNAVSKFLESEALNFL